MTQYMKNGTESGQRKMTSLKKSNQIPDQGKKAIDAERMKLLSTGSELTIH